MAWRSISGVVSLQVSASGVHSDVGVITIKEGKHLTNPGPSSTSTTINK